MFKFKYLTLQTPPTAAPPEIAVAAKIINEFGTEQIKKRMEVLAGMILEALEENRDIMHLLHEVRILVRKATEMKPTEEMILQEMVERKRNQQVPMLPKGPDAHSNQENKERQPSLPPPPPLPFASSPKWNPFTQVAPPPVNSFPKVMRRSSPLPPPPSNFVNSYRTASATAERKRDSMLPEHPPRDEIDDFSLTDNPSTFSRKSGTLSLYPSVEDTLIRLDIDAEISFFMAALFESCIKGEKFSYTLAEWKRRGLVVNAIHECLKNLEFADPMDNKVYLRIMCQVKDIINNSQEIWCRGDGYSRNFSLQEIFQCLRRSGRKFQRR